MVCELGTYSCRAVVDAISEVSGAEDDDRHIDLLPWLVDAEVEVTS
jgi:hypothetical protein